jgi:hypothetical protein
MSPLVSNAFFPVPPPSSARERPIPRSADQLRQLPGYGLHFAGPSSDENSRNFVGQEVTVVDGYLVHFAMHSSIVTFRTRNSAHQKHAAGRRNETGKGIALRAARYAFGVEIAEH